MPLRWRGEWEFHLHACAAMRSLDGSYVLSVAKGLHRQYSF